MGVRAALPVLAAAGIGAAIACGGDSDAIEGTPRPTLTLPPAIEEETILVDTASYGTLGSEYVQEAQEIILNDATILQLADGETPVVGNMSAWYSGEDVATGKVILMGAIAKVSFHGGISSESIELPWPDSRQHYSAFSAALRASYSGLDQGTTTWRLVDVTTFDVTVDLRLNKVVGLVPPFDVVVSPGESPPASPERGFAVPTVTEEQKAAADPASYGDGGRTEDIIGENAALSELLNSPGRTSINFSSYDRGDHRFGFARAYWGDDETVYVTGDFPSIVDQDKETGDYRSEIVHFRDEFARHITVTVDLRRNEIIDVDPDEGD